MAILPLLLAWRRRWRSIGITLGLAGLLLTGGAFYYGSGLNAIDENHVAKYIETEISSIEGTISRMPEAKEKSQALRLSELVIETDNTQKEVTGAVLAYLPPFPEFAYGDRITVSGKLLEPPVFETFDWRAHLARDEIYATVLYPEVLQVEHTGDNALLSGIYSVRSAMAEGLATALPEPHASLAQGLTLGLRSGIPDEVRDQFAVSGTAHLLAISGLHLSIVAGAILLLARGLLGRRGYWYVWLAMAAIWIFVILSGLAPPVIRGAVMASVFLLAELFGRQKSALPALCLAAAVMTAANPQLLWSASFQMSFGAMAGIIFLLPPLETLVRRLTAGFPGSNNRFYNFAYYLGAGLAVTASALAGVAPLIVYYFGTISVVGGAATVAAMPVVPLVIFAGLFTGVAAAINPIIAVPFAALTWIGLTYLLHIIGFFSQFPPFEMENINPAIIWGFYTLLGAIAWWLRRWHRNIEPAVPRPAASIGRPRGAVLTITLAAIALIAVPAGLIADSGSRLQVSYLDVGQGDAVYIRTPAGQDILIDGGPSPQRLAQALGEKMPFWNRTIELMVVTHADSDHLTGLMEALKRYNVNHIIHSDTGSSSSLYREWTQLVEEKNTPYSAVSAGQRLRLEGGMELEILNPIDASNGDTNASSVVINLEYGNISFLFTGDLPVKAEHELIYQRLIPDTTVLKVAHHGSGGSTGEAFLAVNRPEFAAIQSGQNNYGHPLPEVIAALESWCVEGGILRNDLSGTITLLTDGRTLWLK